MALRLSGQGGVFAGRRVKCLGTPNTGIGAGKLEDRVDYSDSLSSNYSIGCAKLRDQLLERLIGKLSQKG